MLEKNANYDNQMRYLTLDWLLYWKENYVIKDIIGSTENLEYRLIGSSMVSALNLTKLRTVPCLRQRTPPP